MSSSHWKACRVVALTTDFGTRDVYVGVLKAVLLARAPDVKIVDVSHSVPPQDVRVGATFVARAAPYFPPGTVHVAVVDPGVGTERRLLVAESLGQCFLGPDNGLLSLALDERARVFELDTARFALPRASSTFHGRDILAPAAAAIVLGLAPEDAGLREVDDWSRLTRSAPRSVADRSSIETEVLFADHFGNLVLNATADDLSAPHGAWSARIGALRVPFAHTYAQVRPGEALLLVDSFHAVEIAVRNGDAAARFGLAPGDRVTLEKRT